MQLLPEPPAGSRSIDHALYLAKQLGLAIFPVQGKTPLLPRGFHQASRDLDTIARWYHRWPSAGIAMPCGPVNGYVVIDVDPRHGGNESLAALVQEHEAEQLQTLLEATGSVRTGGTDKGTHYYLKSDDLALKSHPGWRPGIDIRAGGNYVVIPPSIHPVSGNAYHWLKTLDQAQPVPPWLAKLIGTQAQPSNDGSTIDLDALLPPSPIPEGLRNVKLTSIAGKYWRDGCSQQSILTTLRELNQTRCHPPLEDEELQQIVGSIKRYAVAPFLGENCTDLGNARRLLGMYGHLIHYVGAWKQWLVWDERCWQKGAELEVRYLAQLTIEAIRQEAAAHQDTKERNKLRAWGVQSESGGHLGMMLDLLRSQPGIPVGPEQLDGDPLLLNCQNGTVDLRTGALTPHDPGQLHTKCTPYPYQQDAPAPTKWLAFLQRFLPSESLQHWAQLAIGYCLSGLTGERCFWILHGEGHNGKGTFLAVAKGLLGQDYARQAAGTLLHQRQAGQATNDLADLRGLRLLVDTELPKSTQLNMDLLKQLSGDTDEISARFLYGHWFSFRPQCKLWISTNTRPMITETSFAAWSRVRLVPFTVRILEAEQIDQYDRVLLDAEGPGILKWAVDGFLAYQEQRAAGKRLASPEEIRTATRQYQNDSDLLLQFLAECCQDSQQALLPLNECLSALHVWGVEIGIHPRRFTRSWLTAELEGHGIPVVIKNGLRQLQGFALASSRRPLQFEGNGMVAGSSAARQTITEL